MEPNPDDVYLCTWCGDPVDKYRPPDYPGEPVVGTCEYDGIVLVTTDPEEVKNGE